MKSMQHDHPYLYNLLNGFIGMVASALGVISTFQEQLEYAVRMSGAVVGLIIGLITLWNLIKGKSKR